MAVKQRARKEEDKQARRRTILGAAARMLQRRSYGELTMAEVARKCGLAKGTLYLYFHSKEALFLAALEDELAEWFADLTVQLATIDPQRDEVDRFADMLAATLAARPTLNDLLALVHNVLEQNIEPDVALAFKQMLLARLTLGGRALETVLPRLPEGSGPRLLLRIYAMVVGLRQMADPSPTVAKVLELPEMAPLRVDFRSDLAETIVHLVRGMLATDVPAAPR
jgi:AcrR family transcriptional regulator